MVYGGEPPQSEPQPSRGRTKVTTDITYRMCGPAPCALFVIHLYVDAFVRSLNLSAHSVICRLTAHTHRDMRGVCHLLDFKGVCAPYSLRNATIITPKKLRLLFAAISKTESTYMVAWRIRLTIDTVSKKKK